MRYPWNRHITYDSCADGSAPACNEGSACQAAILNNSICCSIAAHNAFFYMSDRSWIR